MNTDTIFRPETCRRCGVVILAGQSDGLSWRVDTLAVLARDAAVLILYGVNVLVMDILLSGPHAQFWVPNQHDLDRPHRYLVVPHVCGSAHAQRSIRETV